MKSIKIFLFAISIFCSFENQTFGMVEQASQISETKEIPAEKTDQKDFFKSKYKWIKKHPVISGAIGTAAAIISAFLIYKKLNKPFLNLEVPSKNPNALDSTKINLEREISVLNQEIKTKAENLNTYKEMRKEATKKDPQQLMNFTNIYIKEAETELIEYEKKRNLLQQQLDKLKKKP